MLTKQDRQAKYKAIEGLRKIRIENVRRLITLYATTADFSRAIAQSSAMVNQIAGPNPSRAIGEVLARDIERLLNLPKGWLDDAH